MSAPLPPDLRRLNLSRLGQRRFLLIRPAALRLGAVLLLLATLLALWALPQGTVATSAQDLRDWLAGSGDPDQALILGQLRLPRILLALMSGAMLGLAGAAMQSVTGNALADPGLVGVKEGAMVAILGASLGWPMLSPAWHPLIGMAGGVVTMLAVIALSGALTGMRFLLIGIGTSWLLASLITLFMTVGDPETAHSVLIWMAGSLHAASWARLWMALPWAVLGAVLLFATARGGNLAELGAATAVGLGIRLGRLAALRLAAAVMITAAATAAIGSLGFVGLVAPHLARLLTGPRQIALMSGSMLTGALLVLAADSLGRILLAPVQIPAGVVIAMIGVPFFLAILWKRRDEI